MVDQESLLRTLDDMLERGRKEGRRQAFEEAANTLELVAALFRAGSTGPYDSAIRVSDVLIAQAQYMRSLAEKDA